MIFSAVGILKRYVGDGGFGLSHAIVKGDFVFVADNVIYCQFDFSVYDFVVSFQNRLKLLCICVVVVIFILKVK